MPSISIKKAALISAAAKYSTVITSLVFTAILARILTPQDYGIVAVVYVFIAFFAVLSDMGLGTAIIQNKELTEKDISSIFGLSFRIAIVLAIAFCALSFPISILYNNPVYIPVCCILSITIVFSTLNMIPNALLMKEKKFVLVGIRMVAVNIFTGTFTIIFAILGAKYYALVFQSVLASVATFIWNYYSTRPKLTFKYEKTSINKVKSYSKFQLAFNFVNYFGRNLDNLLIGKFIGTSQLAFYNQAYNLMLYPLNYLTYVIITVIHPILSEYQDDRKYIYDQYVKVVKILSLAGAFIAAFCFCASREIILIIFGGQWENSIECFRILSISVFFQMSVSSAGSIYLSLGNTKTMFKSGIIFTLVLVTGIIIGISTGNINTVALLVAIGMVCRFFIDYYFLIRVCFNYSVFEFYKKFIPDIFILLTLLIVMNVFGYYTIENILLSALYKFSLCVAVYLILLVVTKQYKYFLLLLPIKMRRKFSKI